MTRAFSVLTLTVLTGCAPDPVPRTLAVYADSSLAGVAEAIAPRVAGERPGLTVDVMPGTTDGLADRLAANDVTGVFLSADAAAVERLASAGRTVGAGVELARGQIVAVGPPGAAPAPTLASVVDGAARIALPDTAAVPAGRLAREALVAAGLWEAVRPRVVLYPTAGLAVAAVASRDTDVTLVPASDALSSTAVSVLFRLRDDQARPPAYSGVVLSGSGADARAFLDSLAAPGAFREWAAAGFRPPSR